MAKCRYCKKEISKEIAYSPSKGQYYCNKECYELAQDKNKKKYKPQENTARRLLTDYIVELYENKGYDKHHINWALLGSQISNLLKEHTDWKYSGMKYALWYMVEIKEMNLFDDSFNGSPLNLLEFYYDESKQYWFKTEEIKQAINEFDFNDDVVVIKKNVDKKNKYKEIDIDKL